MPCLNNFFGSHTLREFDEILDEDDFASNSENSLATHQSIKAYVQIFFFFHSFIIYT